MHGNSRITDDAESWIFRDVRTVKTQNPKALRNKNRWKTSTSLVAALALSALVVGASAQSSVRVKWSPNPESDIAGYTVFVGSQSGYYTSSQKITSGVSATLSGLAPSTTYYCAVQAFNTAGITSELSSEAVFTTVALPKNFAQWTAAAGLSGTAAGPDAVPFGDGVRNLVKYAFNMNGAAPDTRTLTAGTGLAGLPVFRLVTTGSQSVFTVEFLRRKGDELIYTPQITSDLVNYKPMTGTSTVTSIDAVWDRVIIHSAVNPATNPRLFGRVVVSQNTDPTVLFNLWAGAANLSGTAASANSAPAGDGVGNLLKYAFNLDPSRPDARVLVSGTGTAGMPRISIERGPGGSTFVVEFIRRRNSGLVYTPKLSTDLAAFTAMTGSTTVSLIDSDWERVIVRKSIDPVATPRLFAKVEVALP